MKAIETTYSGYNKFTFKNVYLTGKISQNDWRHTLVEGLGEIIVSEKDTSWPILENAIFDCLDYVGPFFSLEGHGAAHYDHSHGVFANLAKYDSHGCVAGYPRRAWTVNNCKEAINEADVIFAWIDDASCYGTLVELGYAKALGKTIWIAGPTRYQDLWFGYEMADELWFVDEMDKQIYSEASAKDMLAFMLDLYGWKHYAFDSPIEQSFWNVWVSFTSTGPGDRYYLHPQYPIGKYRVDFAHEPTKTAIELDGHATHSSPDAIARDRKRQRHLESEGWHVIRFGGKEIFSSANNCAVEVWGILTKRFAQVYVKTFRFQPGDKVRHPKFGAGFVLNSHREGSTEFVETQFQDKRVQLNLDYAKLEKQQ
jgi:very-short-patch-repair endonuclease